jgi:hypothetical protein
MSVSAGLAPPGQKESATFSFRWPALGSKLPRVPAPKPGQLIPRLAITTFLKQRSEISATPGGDNAHPRAPTRMTKMKNPASGEAELSKRKTQAAEG